MSEKEILEYYSILDWQDQNDLLYKLHKITIAEQPIFKE